MCVYMSACKHINYAIYLGYWRRQWHPTLVLLPGKSHGRRSLVGCSPWGHKESGTTEWLTLNSFKINFYLPATIKMTTSLNIYIYIYIYIAKIVTQFISWRRQWQPTPVLLPGKSHGQRSLVGCSPRGRCESDTTERLHFHFSLSCIGEGNGNPLQCSCLQNPRDGGAWWAAIFGVAQSRIRLKRLNSSSNLLANSKLI